MTGTLPPELGNLAVLSSLQVFKNQLTGTVPDEYLNMSSLRKLKQMLNGRSLPLLPVMRLSNLTIDIFICVENFELRGNNLEGDVGFLCQTVGEINSGQIKIDCRGSDVTCTESCCVRLDAKEGRCLD